MEEESKKKIAMGIGAAVVLVLLAWIVFGRARGGVVADHPDGFKYICQNPACKNEFTLSQADYVNFRRNHPGELLKCPKCGSKDIVQEGSVKERPVTGTPGR